MNEPRGETGQTEPLSAASAAAVDDDAENDVRAQKKQGKHALNPVVFGAACFLAPSEFDAYTPPHTHSCRGKRFRDSPQRHQIDSFARSDNVAVETTRHIPSLLPCTHTPTPHAPRGAAFPPPHSSDHDE